MRTSLLVLLFLITSCNIQSWLNGDPNPPEKPFYGNNDENSNGAGNNNGPVGTATRASYPSISMVYADSYPIENLNLTADGTIVSADISPALPAGLDFAEDGTISGTPTATSAEQTYTITLNNNLTTSLKIAVVDAYIVNSTGTDDDANTTDGECETATPGECTLRAAVMESNDATMAAKDIYIPVGTYNLANQYRSIDTSYSIYGASETGTIIDGGQNGNTFRALNFAPTGAMTSKFSNLTFRNFSHSSQGGVFLITDPDLLNVTISNVTFDSNSVSPSGGALALGGNAGSTFTILNSTFINNSGTNAIDDGGAIFISAGSLIIKDTLFEGNSRTDNGAFGGAIGSNGGTIDIDRSLFDGNSAGKGGAIYKETAGSVTITNSTFINNTGFTSGGALSLLAGANTVRNCTFVSNSTSTSNGGGAIHADTSTTNVVGSIFQNNIDDTTSDACFDGDTTSIGDSGFNLEDANDCAWSAGAGGNSTLNLDSLSNNGGVTQTIALLPGSDAIDMAVTACTNDQRNLSRDGSCDAGAFEFQQ